VSRSRRPWFSGLRIRLVSPCLLARGVGVLVLAFSLGGCHPPRVPSSGGASPETVRPAIAVLSKAVPGQAVNVSDPDLGNVIAVLERIYPSASQQTCRRFALRPANDPEAFQETLVMCQEGSGWSLVKLPALRY